MTYFIRPTCAHCVYWSKDSTAEIPTSGHCHRYPPTVFSSQSSGNAYQKFPLTDQHHWCGEWSDDEAGLLEAAKRSVVETAAGAD